MKNPTKTKTSNLHANDILGSFSPFHTCEPTLDVLDNDADLNKGNSEIIKILNEVRP